MKIDRSAQTLAFVAVLCLSSLTSCKRSPESIAVIPPTCGTLIWETMHGGVAVEAVQDHLHLYWNAPVQEGDTQRQIHFLELALKRNYAGIVIVPDETFAFRTPVQKAVEDSVPVVVVDNELGIHSDRYLSYVLNDEAAGGRMAAERIIHILHGQGSVAILGADPQIQSINAREISLERTLAAEAPQIHIAVRELGDLSVPHEQQAAERLFHADHPVDAIVTLSATSMRGAYYARIASENPKRIPIVGFDQERLAAIKAGDIDSVVIQNTYAIGQTAIQHIASQLQGRSVPEKVYVEPILLTSANYDDHDLRPITRFPMFPWSEQ
jgi:ribose transport system substrate-binding protein